MQAIAFNYLTAFVLGLIVDGVSEGGAVLPASVGSWAMSVGLGATFAGAFVPEPYKGKGIRYKDEHVRRKEGKKAA